MPASVAVVAVLSDIHGVLPALDAVLAEPAVRTADLIVVTGDHASGPQPTAVLDRLLELGDRARLVRGNADRELVALRRGEELEIPDDVTPWAAAELSGAHLELLAGLPHPLSLEVDGFGEVLFCHGTPRDDAEVVLVDSRMSRWREAFADVPDTVRTVVCGHTHMPFVRTVDRRLVVNPGSVGMPYGQPGAHWAMLRGGAVELHRTLVDVDAAIAAITRDSSFPGSTQWCDDYLRKPPSDAEALAAFAPVPPSQPE
ncbi:MAG: metallophosphatase family protein [Actinomycetota bacterium]|nr:metallophosphatase family protein [Actinomycetota bacterium]